MMNMTKIPEYMRGGVERYVEFGIRPGNFLTALFSNDFMGAFMYADATNTAAMKDWANFLYNELPGSCWGSEEEVAAWIAKFADKELPCKS
jgi:uncharacterized membrane protein